jgi:phage portal protein BeeE
MGLLDWFRAKPSTDVATRSYPLSMQEYLSTLANQGGLQFTQSASKEEDIAPSFAAYVQQAYAANGPVFACILARAALFSEARFQWRQFRNGRPGQLFGTPELKPLEIPWPNGTTGDILVRLEQDYSLTGNFYGHRVRDGIDRMRPDWTTIVIGSNMDVDNVAYALDARVVGYIFHPGGRYSGETPVPLRVEEVCHFTGPTPDPLARFRGMSWLTSIVRDIQGDSAATTHKLRTFEHGGPNTAVGVDMPDLDEFNEFVASFKANTEGAANAYKTLFFNSGSPPESKVIGSDMKQMDFKLVQGAGESRIASAAGVPPIIVGFSEGLDAATYSNYALAMRRFADLTIRPMWRMAAACFQSVLQEPNGGAQLWYDDRDIPALKDDIVNRAEVQVKQASAAKLLLDGGYEPDSVTDAITSDDFSRLVHSGLPTVQVQQGAAKTNGKPPIDGEQMQLPAPSRSVLAELESTLGKR